MSNIHTKEMKKDTHFIKLFFTDNKEGNILNFDGVVTECCTSIDEMCTAIGKDIEIEIDEDRANHEAAYGYRIEYTLTPILTNPFE